MFPGNKNTDFLIFQLNRSCSSLSPLPGSYRKDTGLSQLVLGLQVYMIKDECIKRMEKSMFGFIWLGSRSEKETGIDRIKGQY